VNLERHFMYRLQLTSNYSMTVATERQTDRQTRALTCDDTRQWRGTSVSVVQAGFIRVPLIMRQFSHGLLVHWHCQHPVFHLLMLTGLHWPHEHNHNGHFPAQSGLASCFPFSFLLLPVLKRNFNNNNKKSQSNLGKAESPPLTAENGFAR